MLSLLLDPNTLGTGTWCEMSRTFNGPSPTRGRRCKVIQTFPSDPLRACQFPHRLQDSTGLVDLHTRTVAAEDAGCRLDVFLARQPEVSTRTRAKELIDTGRVQVGAARVRPGLYLDAGQQVVFETGPVLPHD